MTPTEAIASEALDPAVLANLRKLENATGATILPQLLASFAEATPPRMAAIHEAIVAGDAHAVYRGAHTLKGSSANLGARRLAQLCGDLETLAQTNELPSMASVLASIEVEFVRVRTALERALVQV